MCWDAVQTFSADTRVPAAARQFCTEQLTSILADRTERHALLDDVTLLVSELITNSLNAGATAATVHLGWHRHQLRIAVDDDAPGLPGLHVATDNDSHGRGLAITQTLSDAWGVEPHPPDEAGKQVWAELSVAPILTTALNCTR